MDAKAKVDEMCGQCTETHAYLKTALIAVGNQDAEIAKLIAERKTLLTGLEALAVEMADPIEEKDAFDEGFNAGLRIYAGRIRTLTNSAKGVSPE